MTDGFQAILEFYNENAPQTFFFKRCGQCHRVGECKEVNKDGQRADKEDS
jgi:hypothetical protein